MYKFNIRVYGLLINSAEQILISDEEKQGIRFSKFPGGGLEYGEGLADALKREFREECDVDIEIAEHFYTTDFFIQSVFDESQVISIYYLVEPKGALNMSFRERPFDFGSSSDPFQAFRWRSLYELEESEFLFETDQKVVSLLKEKWKQGA